MVYGVPNLKDIIKKIVYSKLVYRVSGLFGWGAYVCAKRIDIKYFWCLYLFAAKLQITFGYRSGFFSYLRHTSSAKGSMRTIEQRVIQVADRLCVDNQQSIDETILFATSFVAPTGGHTRLLQTYLSRMPDAKLLISGDAFFTGRQNFLAEQEEICSSLFESAEGRIIFNRASQLSQCGQIELLYQYLSRIRPKAVVLFNEPSDLALLVAALCYGRCNKEIRIYYCHHADDFLPFLGNAFHGHIDLVSNQEEKCKEIPNRSLIRISARNRKSAVAVSTESFSVFSFVPMTKLGSRNSGDEQYADLVAALSKKGVRFVIATRNGEGRTLYDFLEQSGADMALVTIDEQCFDISKYAGLIHAYLDTFPLGGGLSIVDGLSLGVPVMINAKHGYGVFRDAAVKEFMFSNSAEIMEYLMRLQLDVDFYGQQSQRAHHIFLEAYDESAMVRALKTVVVGGNL